ncbi:40S ribosomal protein SA [Lemmus lemmus]
MSREHPWEVMPDLYFYRDPEEIEKDRLLLRRLSPRKNFKVNGPHQLLSSLLLSQRRLTGLRVYRCPRCPSSSSLLKIGVPSQPLRIGQQLPQRRPPSELEPPLSGPELLCRHLSKGKKVEGEIKFLQAVKKKKKKKKTGLS